MRSFTTAQSTMQMCRLANSRQHYAAGNQTRHDEVFGSNRTQHQVEIRAGERGNPALARRDSRTDLGRCITFDECA